MQSFQQLLQHFNGRLKQDIFPDNPENLYQPAGYMLRLGGKRIRPILCLMGCELFHPITENAYHAATAIEIFHNFTLVHDDIMDEAPLRRGKSTVHEKYNSSIAILSGDVMLVQAYDYLNKVAITQKGRLFDLFSRTAKEVCEGQQLDMDMEDIPLVDIKMEDYLKMITLKTSVLLASSLQIGALIGEADEESLDKIYSFGKNMGIAFQIQDDYLDAFGNSKKFGKQIGGDILSNKKTFLLLKAFELADSTQRARINSLLNLKASEEKITGMLGIYEECGVDDWAEEQKKRYASFAENDLKQISAEDGKKKELYNLMEMLLNRES